MKKTIISILTITLIAMTVCGCGANNISSKETIMETNYTDRLNIEEMKSDVILFLGGTEASTLSTFDNVEIQWEDICNTANIGKSYISNSAYYLQAGNYMYRFQLNKEGKIESYIKYEVEA